MHLSLSLRVHEAHKELDHLVRGLLLAEVVQRQEELPPLHHRPDRVLVLHLIARRTQGVWTGETWGFLSFLV